MNVFTTLQELQDLVRRGAMGTILVVTAQALLSLIYFSAVLTRIERKLDTMSAATDALLAAVSDLSTALTDDTTAITTAIAELKAAQDSGDADAIAQATANIEAAATSIKANTSSLTAAITPAA